MIKAGIAAKGTGVTQNEMIYWVTFGRKSAIGQGKGLDRLRRQILSRQGSANGGGTKGGTKVKSLAVNSSRQAFLAVD